MNNCKNCRFRATYDRNPQSILGVIWKWHITWCPGWKSYMNALPAREREQPRARYS